MLVDLYLESQPIQHCSANKDLELPAYAAVMGKQRPRTANICNSDQQTNT